MHHDDVGGWEYITYTFKRYYLGNESVEINQYQPNTYAKMSTDSLPTAINNLSLMTRNPYHQNEHRQPMWSSPFVATSDSMNTFSNQRDEGLGDSPPRYSFDQ